MSTRKKRQKKVKFHFDDQETLDCDTYPEPESPPPRRAGTIKVRLRYAGRAKPLPFTDD